MRDLKAFLWGGERKDEFFDSLLMRKLELSSADQTDGKLTGAGRQQLPVSSLVKKKRGWNQDESLSMLSRNKFLSIQDIDVSPTGLDMKTFWRHVKKCFFGGRQTSTRPSSSSLTSFSLLHPSFGGDGGNETKIPKWKVGQRCDLCVCGESSSGLRPH